MAEYKDVKGLLPPPEFVAGKALSVAHELVTLLPGMSNEQCMVLIGGLVTAMMVAEREALGVHAERDRPLNAVEQAEINERIAAVQAVVRDKLAEAAKKLDPLQLLLDTLRKRMNEEGT